MKYVNYANTDIKLSQVCLGAMLMGTALDQADSDTVLDDFLAQGGNFIDTANCYAWWRGQQYTGDESETVLGKWMQERSNRDKIFLATKAGARIPHLENLHKPDGDMHWDRINDEYEYLSPKTIRAAIEGSLRRLKTDYIDLYYAHIDDRETPLEETLEEFNKLVQEGKVRYLGCSNIRTWRMERARQISTQHNWAKYTAMQLQYSYLRTKAGIDIGDTGAELLDYLKSNDDLTLMAYSPLLKGIYNDQAKREANKNWHRFDSVDSAARLAALNSVAEELGVTSNNLVLSWLMHQPKIIPIIGFSKKEQYFENMQSIDIDLSDEQMVFLNSAGE